MPTSHWKQLNEVMDIIMSIRPKSVLDVGIGFGKYGVLIREYLELWDGRNVYDKWQVKLDGIEVFREYHNPIYDYVYNTIYYGDALDIIPNLGRYDLILLVDVLEHFTKDTGLSLIQYCTRTANHTLVVTPLHVSDQGTAFGNKYETHRSSYVAADFSKHMLVANDRSLICVVDKV